VTESTSTSEILHMEGIVKDFGATRALDRVSLVVHPGEVHALVGHNGSGKSTLVKILTGYHRPDSGVVAINEQPVNFPVNPSEMKRRGVHVMHQDIGLAPGMSVLENLRITSFETGFARHIRWRDERTQAAFLLARFQVAIDPEQSIASLSPTERAIVGLVRAFQGVQREPAGSIVVLDEPTAFLPREDVDRLFDVIREVAKAGCAVLLITHHIDEPFSIADNVTVLRNGAVVASEPVSSLTPAELINLIVGGHLERASADPIIGEKVLSVDGLSGGSVVDASFVGLRGEIVGLTGLLGAGHEDIPYLVYGSEGARAGQVAVLGREYTHRTPAMSVRKRLALLPADRQRQGAIPKASVAENITISNLSAYRNRFRKLNRRKEDTAVLELISAFNVLPRRPSVPLSELSGGNQQKALLARWISVDPEILMLHEPTQGIDIGSCHEIFSLLQQHAAKGRLVLIASNQHEDLARICTRVLIFRKGRIVAEIPHGELTTERLLAESYAM